MGGDIQEIPIEGIFGVTYWVYFLENTEPKCIMPERFTQH